MLAPGVELITVPGTGSRSVREHLASVYPEAKRLSKVAYDSPSNARINCSHISEEVFQRLTTKHLERVVLSVWRDPLQIAVTNSHKPYTKQGYDIMPYFRRMQELAQLRPVLFVDLRFIPYRIRHKKRGPTNEAYERKDIAYFEENFPLLAELRAFDWHFWTEDWWR